MIESAEQRSKIMRTVKSRHTEPEMKVRRLLHRMGFRYRLHKKDLPGKPDIVFGPRRKVIFVHGCFWHGHDCKRGNRMPVTNAAYWKSKIARNVERHGKHLADLGALGWSVLTLWECELKSESAIARRLRVFLEG